MTEHSEKGGGRKVIRLEDHLPQHQATPAHGPSPPQGAAALGLFSGGMFHVKLLDGAAQIIGLLQLAPAIDIAHVHRSAGEYMP